MFRKKKIVLISGGAGFIGSHTVDKFLQEGFEVRSFDNLSGGNFKNISHLNSEKNFKFEKADLLNLEKLKNFIKECEYVVHFAGVGDIVPSIKNPKKYFSNNTQGTVCLLDSLNLFKIKKFVYAASSSCYGKAQHLPRKKTQLIHYTLMHFQNIKENNYVFIGIKFIGYQLIQLEFLTLMVQDQELQELMELYLVYF